MQYLVKVVSTQPMLVSTPCFKHKAKTCKIGQCVDTSPSSVDTSSVLEHLLDKTGQVVSTLDQVLSTLVTFPELLLGCIGTVCRHYLK
ncbi:hypothetical protein Taro_041416 [Colocasia esculenta]|uniref:Uncharacterized protein n=1 Tax=Colocasia esculenta TaxID=4460 RepID=A0A843WFS9_COLES|nr:hypothetical protein [Colocasia esculenta]